MESETVDRRALPGTQADSDPIFPAPRFLRAAPPRVHLVPAMTLFKLLAQREVPKLGEFPGYASLDLARARRMAVLDDASASLLALPRRPEAAEGMAACHAKRPPGWVV